VAAAKSLFHRTWFAGVRRAFGIESRIQFKLLRGANYRIARQAGLNKQAPKFLDRSFKD